MTVRHRQRKGARGSCFLYARGKGFSKPQLFPPKPPEDSLKVPNNPTRPASFLRQFSPQHSPVARLFRGKKGLFCPQRPPYPPFCPPERPVLPRLRPFFCPACARMETRLAPVLPGTPAPAHTPGTPEVPAYAAFLPARARFRPPCAARTPEGCPARRRNRPAVRRQPARCRRPPPEGQPAVPPRHTLGAGNPDCRGRLSRFAVKKCAPLGGNQIPGHDG